MQNLQQWFPAVGRVLIGLLFVSSAMKFMSVPMVTGYIASVGIPGAAAVFWLSTIVEVGAGLMLILGFRTRLAAWALFVFTGLTIVFFHNDVADQAQFTAALKNLAIMGGLLYVIMWEAGMRKENASAPMA